MNEESLKQENSFLKEMIRTYYQPEIEKLNNIIKRLDQYVINVQISEYGDTLEEAEKYLEKLKESANK